VAGDLIILLLLVFLFSYIQQKIYDNKMLRFAYEDKLTGLSSYMKFCEDVNNKMKNAKDKEYALILFDVNKFKVINETYGFEIGDIILKKLAEAMKECISSEGLCCRMSNDYYLIFEKYSGNKMDILRVMSLIEGRIKDLQINESHKINILISTGVFIFDKDEALEYNGNLTKYISRAKMAHATVKGKHDVRVRFFDEKIQSDFKEERNIENEMDKALEKGEFEVYYQPKYDLVRGCVAGAEALIRWNHPQKGLVFPNDFIPVFEKNGFIIQIDEFMFETACRDIRDWLDAGIEPVRISVNLSRNHIRSGDMIDMLKSNMARYKVDPKYLEIELTESIAYEDINALREIVERIHNIDLAISIDDFGSGYSSLSLLEAIEFDVLKLDKTFLNNLEKSEKSKVILEHIIALAKAINVVVLCEGVETQEQANYLRSLGCDLIQGFLFSKALRKQDFESLIE
ncbi:MAG: bifunctional diguanylate cyclase/phosphodiesterase, partial [Erysipelotrichaceae bacterium]